MRIGFRSDGSVKHLELAKRVGLPVIELGWTPEIRVELDDIERRLKDFGIGVSAILTGEHHDLDGLKFALDWTRRLGAFAFVTHPEPIALHDTEKAREFAALFAPAADHAAKLGVSLAVHSCGLGPEPWDVMFAAVPALTLKYDPSFSLEAGRNYRGEIIKYCPRIVHVHVKDEMLLGRETDFSNGIMRYQYVPAGMGDIHWGSVIALLLEGGYRGDLAIETHSSFWWEHVEWDLALCKRHLEQFIPPTG